MGKKRGQLSVAQKAPAAKKLKRDASTESLPPLLSLPDEILKIVLSYAFPQVSRWDESEMPQWQWVGIISLTCRRIRDVTREIAPKVFDSSELYFENDEDTDDDDDSVDANTCRMWQKMVPGLLCSLQEFPWRGERLLELHIDKSCFELYPPLEWFGSDTEPIPSIMAALRSILTSASALPNLEWLDICAPIETDGYPFRSSCNLLDTKTLLAIPFCLPKVTKLTLVGIFDHSEKLSPRQFRKFLRAWSKPLQALTLGQVRWMNDAHVQLIAEEVGSNLSTLELLDCNYAVEGERWNDFEAQYLTVASATTIAQTCRSLESFSLTCTEPNHFMTRNLESIVCQNPGLCQLNVSGTTNIDATSIIALLSSIPNLRTFRAHWCDWLNDEILLALITSQEQRKEQHGGNLCLKTIGIVRTAVSASSVRRFLEHQSTGRVEMGRSKSSITRDNARTSQWWSLVTDFPDANFAPIQQESAFGSTFCPSLNGVVPSYRCWEY